MQALRTKRVTSASAAGVLLAAFMLAYGGDAGRGFIKDDFRWIRETQVRSAGDVVRLFERTDGFYRPVVSVSFAINSATAGLDARAYGWTNLTLAVADAVLVGLLARGLALSAPAALLAAGAWAFNFHGINMAVLWISGRTSLLATLFAAVTAVAFVRGRTRLAGLCCLLALLSKEEAILLPVLLAGWRAYDEGGALQPRLRAAMAASWPCFAALAVYLMFRIRTDAFWPGAAPAYYRLTLSPPMLASNILEYADRALTWPAVAAIVPCAAARFRVRPDAPERRVLLFGAAWLACMFAVTVFVPARSSLYAVLPSVGSALAAGAFASASLRAAPHAARRAMAVLTLVPLLLLPIYWDRNERWVRLAELSAAVLDQTRAAADRHPGHTLALVDDPSARFNLESAFGGLWPDAAALYLGSPARATLGEAAAGSAVRLRLEGTRLVREE